MLSGQKRRIVRVRMSARAQGWGKRKTEGKESTTEIREGEKRRQQQTAVVHPFKTYSAGITLLTSDVLMQRGAPSSEAMRDRFDRIYEKYYNYNPGGEDEDAASADSDAEDRQRAKLGLPKTQQQHRQ